MQRTAGVIGACLFTAAILGNLFAQEAAETAPPASAKAEDHQAAQIAEEIRQKLHEPITLQLKNTPVRDAIEELLTKQKIDFWFDDRALSEESISLDGPEITCNMHNVSIRAALQRILTQGKLSWVCEDAGIRITSGAEAINSPFARVYEISDLLEEPTVEVVPPSGTAAQAAQFGGGPMGASGGAGLGGKTPLTPEEWAAREARLAKEAARPEMILINMIMQTTGGPPNGPWMEADGEGGSIHLIQTSHTKLLVVRQTEQVHAAIEDLLNELLSHQHAGHEDDEAVRSPKNAVRGRTGSAVRIVVKGQPAPLGLKRK